MFCSVLLYIYIPEINVLNLNLSIIFPSFKKKLKLKGRMRISIMNLKSLCLGFLLFFQIKMSDTTIRLIDQLRESANEVILYIRGDCKRNLKSPSSSMKTELRISFDADPDHGSALEKMDSDPGHFFKIY